MSGGSRSFVSDIRLVLYSMQVSGSKIDPVPSNRNNPALGYIILCTIFKKKTDQFGYDLDPCAVQRFRRIFRCHS